MSKEILRFKGLSLNRDEQSAGHGELSVCAGVELHDGALRPSVLEGTMVQHALKVGDDTATLLYVHETASYRHFICKFGNALYWFTEDGSPVFVREEHSEDVAIADAEAFIQQLINQGIPERDISYVLIDENTVRITWPTYSQVPIHTFDNGDAVISVNSVGNTLVVLADSGVHYILWKDETYKYLGTEIPFVEICFRPSENHRSKFDRSTLSNTSYDREVSTAYRGLEIDTSNVYEINNTTGKAVLKAENRASVNDAVWALVNQANNTVAKDGHFYAPFLIRYCYRLYDGQSLVMHSAPVFMNVSLPESLRVFSCNVFKVVSEEEVSSGSDFTTWTYAVGDIGMSNGVHVTDEWGEEFNVSKTVFSYKPSNVGIRYLIRNNVINSGNLQKLKEDWKDIVKSVDIFVSPMMSREKTGELIENFMPVDEACHGVRDGSLEELTAAYSGYYYTRINQGGDGWRYFRHDIEYNTVANIPLISKEEYLRKLINCSTFYKLTSLELETITASNNYRDLSYDKTIIPNITSQELMKDDYHTHCRLLPIQDRDHGMYIYNHRLNLYGMKEKLFSGFNIETMMNNYSDSSTGNNIKFDKIVVELNTDDGTKYVEQSCTDMVYEIGSMCSALLFYPDSRATKMIVYVTVNGQAKKIELPLENSPFLNGAVCSTLFWKDESELSFVAAGESPTVADLVPMRNMVITSEVDDPYYFPIEGRNTVGVGGIIGIAAVTRALSQGQVGDHDLVVFATDGIWVMKVSSEGTYNSLHNISREVCTNPKSICQLDQSVVFGTQRSLSRFVESNVVSLSEVLDGPVRNWSSLFGTFFNNIEPIARQLNFFLPAAPNPSITPIDMFNKGSVFYDYAGDRVMVLPQNTSQDTVALVFSIRDQAWATMAIPAIMAVVPGYPSPFVQLGNGKVMILDKPYGYRSSGNDIPGLVLTRELTFSDTMDVIRGYQHYADCGTAPTLFIFGSNDQRTWQALGNSNRWFQNYLPGRSFHFFRVAVYTQMKPSEEYQQLMLEVINKYAKL